MKLNPNTQLGLNISKEMVDNIVALQCKEFISKALDPQTQVAAIVQFIEMFSTEMVWEGRLKDIIGQMGITPNALHIPKNTNYLLTSTAIELAGRIKIDEDKFDVRFLSKVKSKKITFLLGKGCFIRYIKRSNEIFAVRVTATPMEDGSKYVHYCSFKINTQSGRIIYIDRIEDPLKDDNFRQFIQLLIFTELSELEVVVIPAKSKTVYKGDKYVNDDRQSVTVVDSTWNKMIIRTEGFKVRGHFRLQAAGKNWQDRKLVYVDEFQKEGYIRHPKKTMDSAPSIQH